MNVNIGLIDRGLHVIVGLIGIGLAASAVIGAWGFLDIIPLATGLFRFCPLHTVLGIDTCRVKP